ncbi:MAG: M14 family metallopeptidase [bacterium]|nr:M14 family metallopeptidase [bacterium]
MQLHHRLVTCLACTLAALPSLACAQAVKVPLSAAEQSGFTRTSTHAEMRTFVKALSAMPAADRLRVGSAGESNEGRDLLTVTVGAPLPKQTTAVAAGDRLRILINANIHGGEVEGKEAVMGILRDFSLGQHEDLLKRAVIVFVPIYNADGNDDIDRKHRVSQNGPDGGVGDRPNAQGLDLNRDFIKVESPECRGLLGLVNRFDPHLFMDLHTTNGSSHGYHLTYSPSLSTNVDAELDGFVRDVFLPEVRGATLEKHGFRTFDYGNFGGRQQKSWSTYDHRPRFGTNYMGLRNRFAVLAEAFSYVPFKMRVAATRAFVLENLRAAVAHEVQLRELCARADRQVVERDASVQFAWDTKLEKGHQQDVLVGILSSVEIEGLGTRRIAGEGFTAEPMLVRDRFTSARRRPLPAAWVVQDADEAVLDVLKLHGLEVTRLTADANVEVSAFMVAKQHRVERPFQGHNEISLDGEWKNHSVHLPAGTLLVRADQALARVAAQLLEPQSEDSLTTWNFFDDHLHLERAHPVLCVDSLAGLDLAGE